MLDKLRQFIVGALAAHRLNKVLQAENETKTARVDALEADKQEAERILDEALNELGS